MEIGAFAPSLLLEKARTYLEYKILIEFIST